VRLMPKITPSYEALLCRLNESPNEALLRVLNDRWAPLARYSYTRERIRTDSEFRARLEAAAWTEVSFWRSLVIDERVRDGVAGLANLYPNKKSLKIDGEHIELSLRMRRQPLARVHVRQEALNEETDAVLQLRKYWRRPRIAITAGRAHVFENVTDAGKQTGADAARPPGYRGLTVGEVGTTF